MRTNVSIVDKEWANLTYAQKNHELFLKQIPDGSWTLIADGNRAGVIALNTCSGSYSVPAYGSAILVQGQLSTGNPLTELLQRLMLAILNKN